MCPFSTLAQRCSLATPTTKAVLRPQGASEIDDRQPSGPLPSPILDVRDFPPTLADSDRSPTPTLTQYCIRRDKPPDYLIPSELRFFVAYSM
jgi:hypothetical protein